MLKPYICAVCEKVIIEQVTPGLPDPSGPASLISLFSKIYVRATSTASGEAGSIPADAVVPKTWSIYTEWETEPGDENRKYQLAFQLLYPDGKPFGQVARVVINVAAHRRGQVTINATGFPIGQEGFYTARLQIEEDEKPVGAPVELKVEVIKLSEPASKQPLTQ